MNTTLVGSASSCKQRSKIPVTSVVAVAELLARFGSNPVCVTVAVLEMTGLDLGETFTLNRTAREFENPGFSENPEQVTVPLLPIGGVVQSEVGKGVPLLLISAIDENVVLGGRTSVNVTPFARLGPLFWIIIVYGKIVPAETGPGGALLVIDKSARVPKRVTPSAMTVYE
jgi:hypothetical protein